MIVLGFTVAFTDSSLLTVADDSSDLFATSGYRQAFYSLKTSVCLETI
jgi:hypothetical protein